VDDASQIHVDESIKWYVNGHGLQNACDPTRRHLVLSIRSAVTIDRNVVDNEEIPSGASSLVDDVSQIHVDEFIKG
jgi:hypothetical protein